MWPASAPAISIACSDAGIVRHRGKIEAVINNARRAVELVETEGSLAPICGGFEPEARRARPPARRSPRSDEATPCPGPQAAGLAVYGPTTAYAFMQSMGLVNDHLEGCDARPRSYRARRRFDRP